jgi:hypothetical protein
LDSVISLVVCGNGEALSCVPYRRGRNAVPLSKKLTFQVRYLL